MAPNRHTFNLLVLMKSKTTPSSVHLEMSLSLQQALPFNWLWERSWAIHKYRCVSWLRIGAGQALTEPRTNKNIAYPSGQALENL